MADSSEQMRGFSLLLMRVVVGAIMLYYGMQDVFGLMGGQGFYGASQTFADSFQADLYIGQIAIVARLVAAVFLIAGFLTRYMAAVICSLAVIAAIQGGQTTESLVKTTSVDPLAAVGYPSLIAVICMVLVLQGGGLLSLDDRMKTKRRKAKVAQLS